MNIPFTRGFSILGKSVKYHPDTDMRDVTDSSWETIKGVSYAQSVASFPASRQGVYVVANTGANAGAAITLTLLGIVALLTTMWCLKYRTTDKCQFMPDFPFAEQCFCVSK